MGRFYRLIINDNEVIKLGICSNSLAMSSYFSHGNELGKGETVELQRYDWTYGKWIKVIKGSK